MENKIIITNYSSSFGEHEDSLYSLRKSIQGLSRSQRQKYQSHGDAWWTLRIHPLGTTRFFSPKCWYQSTHGTSNSEPRHRPRGGSRGKVRGSTNKVRRVHPLGNMNPSNRRSEILTVPSRGSDESSVIQRLSHANFNQSDQQLESVPTRRVRGETTENVFSRVVLCSDRSDATAATLTSGRAVTSLAGRHFWTSLKLPHTWWDDIMHHEVWVHPLETVNSVGSCWSISIKRQRSDAARKVTKAPIKLRRGEKGKREVIKRVFPECSRLRLLQTRCQTWPMAGISSEVKSWCDGHQKHWQHWRARVKSKEKVCRLPPPDLIPLSPAEENKWLWWWKRN